MLQDLLDDPAPPPFALLARAGRPGVELLLGDVVDVDRLADIPLPGAGGHAATLALIPYRQLTERGFECHDDGAPLRCLRVRSRVSLDRADVVAALAGDVDVTPGGFDVADDEYADIVGRVIRDEIGRGAGANFVIRRDYLARLTGSVPHAALRLFGRLLTGEPGAYWTFAVHAGDVTMVGATPERHVSVDSGTVVMNPISGTYRVPAGGATTGDLLRFLADPKETEELFMVVDEELKMMSAVCQDGGRVLGPFLKEMSHLVHTEYLLEGTTRLDVRDVLRETMFAPTVTGSPLENAARVITRYEVGGRGYYAGVAALIESGDDGLSVDAPILIRTAQLAPDGSVRVPVGATLVRHSVAGHEVAETHAKAAGVLTALGVLPLPAPPAAPSPSPSSFAADPEVAAALTARNRTLAPFWLRPQGQGERPALAGRSVLIVDAEDRWTAMLAHLLRRLGMRAEVRRWSGVDPADGAAYDLLLAGPGPGDPRDVDDPRIARLHDVVRARLDADRPLLAVCLSHQVLAGLFGLPLGPLPQPYQGTQRLVPLFGRETRVGFYNTYAARLVDGAEPPGVEVAAHPETGEVFALRGAGFASVQFHLESILSADGIDLLAELVTGALAPVHDRRAVRASLDLA
ncbi:anthranilate synthase family protein [Jiangella sp. DSM 45060]|uniref:anthranilate synthase family protein n=1 Tax=Jiangella sp. DSM 45060 TaxID=1798224 RepID=UPI000879396E|nr:anthranilate synthase family protein [Jiangella sp. DSM 45060]SDS40889.1 phenazine biosynthesis protein phzE [Jiangella sp. DSM 45060]